MLKGLRAPLGLLGVRGVGGGFSTYGAFAVSFEFQSELTVLYSRIKKTVEQEKKSECGGATVRGDRQAGLVVQQLVPSAVT